MGVSTLERNLLEGLQASQRRLSGKDGGLDLDVQQLSSQALARLAANPPTKVGRVQRATAKWLLRVSRLVRDTCSRLTGVRIPAWTAFPSRVWILWEEYEPAAWLACRVPRLGLNLQAFAPHILEVSDLTVAFIVASQSAKRGAQHKRQRSRDAASLCSVRRRRWLRAQATGDVRCAANHDGTQAP
eukprot:7389722-Prymnesium_polylepis.1